MHIRRLAVGGAAVGLGLRATRSVLRLTPRPAMGVAHRSRPACAPCVGAARRAVRGLVAPPPTPTAGRRPVTRSRFQRTGWRTARRRAAGHARAPSSTPAPRSAAPPDRQCRPPPRGTRRRARCGATPSARARIKRRVSDSRSCTPRGASSKTPTASSARRCSAFSLARAASWAAASFASLRARLSSARAPSSFLRRGGGSSTRCGAATAASGAALSSGTASARRARADRAPPAAPPVPGCAPASGSAAPPPGGAAPPHRRGPASPRRRLERQGCEVRALWRGAVTVFFFVLPLAFQS